MKKTTYLCQLVLCVFLSHLSPIKATNLSEDASNNEIQRVRLDFTMPNGYIRHLLLGFTPDNAASDGVDYGYDTLNFENLPYDLNWIIEGQRYIIQGVGEFNETNQYPLGMFLSNDGTIEIALTALENFESPIDVFIFDAVLETYTLINETSFSGEFTAGDYENRFYISFSNQNANEDNNDETSLSLDDQTELLAQIKYHRNTNELHITANYKINQIEVYNLLGKLIFKKQNIYSHELTAKLSHLNSAYALVRIYSDMGITTKKILLK